ncbi:MAG: cytidine deaminase [Paludibacteraceae bacterium]|nr:cytidine deaminase [Paludibacteraceae bacterium]
MRQLVKTIKYEVLDEADFSAEERMLVDAAKEAVKGSYSPYSLFAVGAAVLLDNGVVVRGANQENGAYPSGLCAERTALFAAGANYPEQKVVAIAIAAFSNGAFLQEPITPCGSCAQVMAETEARAGLPMKILLYGANGSYRINGVGSILPFAFSLK